MAEFKLATGQTVIVDDSVLKRALLVRWHIGGEGYVKHSYRSEGKVKSLYLHTFVTGLLKVDHGNANKLDNRRRNLRPATCSQNSANARKRRGTSSRYKGVSWDRRADKWRAQVSIKGCRTYLGVFESDIEAAAVYNEAAKGQYGPFARLNEL